MRILWIILSLLLVFSGCATTAYEAEPYSLVIEAEGKASTELFDLANRWAVTAFTDASSVIEYSDKESGVISGKYSTTVRLGLLDTTAVSTISVETRDDKLRVVLSDPRYIDPAYPESGLKPLTRAGALDELQLKWERLASSLEDYVLKGGDDW